MDHKDLYPWKDGNYTGTGTFTSLILTGNKGMVPNYPDWKIEFEHGDFGEADTEVVEATGHTKYTVVIKSDMMGTEWDTKCVLTDDGKLVSKSSLSTEPIEVLEWITQEEADRIANDGDSIEAPANHYKLEPERQGKMVWITGASCLGKSTTAQLLSRHHGYVYYEGDCFYGLRNPYIPSDVPEPSLAQLKQRKLVGEGAKQRQEMTSRVMNAFTNLMNGSPDLDDDAFEEASRAMCNDIKKERERIGGDWAICGVLLTKKDRDFVRLELGGELKIVCLDMKLEDMLERVRSRHAGDENYVNILKKTYDLWEPAGDDEPNTLKVMVTPDMSCDDVLEMVVEKINMTDGN